MALEQGASMIAVLIPSYKRPNSLENAISSLLESTPAAIPYVIAEPDDGLTIEAAVEAGAQLRINEHSANYAGAINTGFESTSEPFLFAGADDLCFHPGWLDKVMSVFATESTQVVGTNDLLNPFVALKLHATHYAFRRSYIDEVGGTWEKGPGVVMYEELDHQYTDTAFIGVARARKVFQPCLDAVVEHMHFLAGKSLHDETYERAYRREAEDRAIYLEKKEQWVHLLDDPNVL